MVRKAFCPEGSVNKINKFICNLNIWWNSVKSRKIITMQIGIEISSLKFI